MISKPSFQPSKPLYTNLYNGQFFKEPITDSLKKSTKAIIASGYTSLDILKKFEEDFLRISREDGFILIIGMAFHEGLSSKKMEFLRNLHLKIKNPNNESGIFLTRSPFHGKIYLFYNGNLENYFLGSSNFSQSGLFGNIECTIPVNDPTSKSHLEEFIENLKIEKLLLPISNYSRGKKVGKKFKEDKHLSLFNKLNKHNVNPRIALSKQNFEIDLIDIVQPNKFKSNVNTYFGKGRENKSTGSVAPRPWYEIEIVCSSSINTNPLYPHGEFLMLTDDGLEIPMKTQGSYHKNLRSINSLQIFGRWFKGKLERAGVLSGRELITEDTLLEYGCTKMTFYKLEEHKYYVTF